MVFFFSYLPRTHQPVLNGAVCIALLAICLLIYFVFRFNIYRYITLDVKIVYMFNILFVIDVLNREGARTRGMVHRREREDGEASQRFNR